MIVHDNDFEVPQAGTENFRKALPDECPSIMDGYDYAENHVPPLAATSSSNLKIVA
jgi:hypothetical protein